MARILNPAEFGLIAMASVIIAISRIFIESGLGDSLVQKQNCTQIDYNTIFYFNLCVSLLLFVIIFFLAPSVSSFFGYPDLTPVIRALALKPAFYSFSIVQTAIIHKTLAFKKIAKSKIPAFVLSGLIGILLAYQGYGVWSLVIQTLLETLLYNIFLWFSTTWRPSAGFDRDVFKFHFAHGSKLLVVGILGAIYRNIFSLIIGKFFSASQLGFYSRADSFKVLVYNNTVGLIQTVSYPVMATVQDDTVALKARYRKILQASVFVILPVIAILINSAEEIIVFLLTDKWLPTAPILIVLLLAAAFSPFNSINLNILKVKRRTDLLLRVDVINKLLILIVVGFTVNLGFDFLVLTNLIMAVAALFINNYYTNKLIGYSIKEQLSDLWPLILAFVVSTTGVIYVKDILPSNFLILNIGLVATVTGAAYLMTIFVTSRRLIFELIEMTVQWRPGKSV